MPNISEVNRELVKAFNINLRFNDIAFTNLTVQNLHGKDHIVVSFDKNMDSKQCMKYLNNMKEKIIKRSYRDEKAAGVSYNLKFFPFAFNTKHLPRDDKGRKRFSVEIDEGVVFNLKCYLAKALAGDVTEGMGKKRGPEYLREHIYNTSFDRNSYLYCMHFYDKGLQKDFVDSFLANIEGYENAPRDYLEIIGNCVYIKKSIFDDIEFIKDIIAYNASLECRYLQTPSAKNKTVDKLKYTMIDFMDRTTDIPVRTIIRTSHNGSNENSVLIPIVNQIKKDSRLLNSDDVYKINSVFDMEILSDIGKNISARLPKSGSSDGIVYGIDFADVDIAYCVLSKIIESSVINKDHELSIDPELPRTLLAEASPTQWESPTRSQDEALNDSPRRGSEKLLLHTPVNSAGTSKGFPPLPQLNSIAVSYGVPGPSKSGGNLGAAAASGSIPGSSLWSQSGASSSRGAGENMPKGSSSWCLPPSTSSLTTRNDPISSNLGIFADPPEDTENICSMKEKQQVTKEKEEEKLSEALLYTLNLMNYTLDGVYTNFFAKDGKIVSLLHDNVDRKKYFQAVRAYIIEEYYEDEEEARELYDLDEFPFKLNCEGKQRKIVVANISSGALSNLKILFSQKFGKNVDAIDISVVKKVEKREKDEWVDRQRSEGDSLEEACKGCFPDEGAMKIIPIAFEGGEYVLDRSRDTCEVNLLFKEQLRRSRGTSLEKRKSSDKPLTEEEKNLFKELLYWFNSNNYALDPPHTNFIVKNGKIASLIDDSVNVKEYLQEVIDKTKEEYRVNKKEAYDLNEFPFKFLSNCEKNQETTVVANISSGALLNLKKLFIQEHKKKVEIKDIDINIVEKDVKSKKDEWVNFQVRNRLCPEAAIATCYPDESALEYISITKGEGGHWIDRNYDALEVKSFRKKRWPARGARNATTTEESKKDDSSSGYSSGFVTDAEKVSSKAEVTISGYEFMDYENTRGGSPKRKSPSPEGGGNSRKSPKRDSLPLSRLESLSLSSSSHQIGKC